MVLDVGGVWGLQPCRRLAEKWLKNTTKRVVGLVVAAMEVERKKEVKREKGELDYLVAN